MSINAKQSNQNDIESQHKTKQENDTIYVRKLMNVIFFIICIFAAAVPIAQFVMANKFKSEMSTSCNSFLTPYVWMIVNGVTIWFENVLPFVWMTNIDNKEIDEKLFSRTVICFFRLAWIICGSVMFWRDCPHLENKTMNDFYWFVLFFSLVSWYIFSKMLKDEIYEKNNTNKTKKINL